MKIRILAVVSLAFFSQMFFADCAHAIWHPFKKKQQSSASGQMVDATAQKGKIARGWRSFKYNFTSKCDSSKAGRIDGFRRCLRSSLSSTGMDIDKLSSVLALDKNGNPLNQTIQRTIFKQEWFRRQLVFAQLSGKILNNLNQAHSDLAVIQGEIETEKTSPSKKERQNKAHLDKEQLYQKKLDSYNHQLADVWHQYGLLQVEMGQTPTYSDDTEQAEVPFMPIPMPDATDAVFSPTGPVQGALMSSAFSAALDGFRDSNPNVMDNFCNNFFTLGGYEEDYIRMGDKGNVTQRGKEAYQKAKNSIIAIQCSEPFMTGLIWRKLYSLCRIGQTAQTIAACSGFSSNEVADSLYAGESQN
jgi:hypothetical protein